MGLIFLHVNHVCQRYSPNDFFFLTFLTFPPLPFICILKNKCLNWRSQALLPTTSFHPTPILSCNMSPCSREKWYILYSADQHAVGGEKQLCSMQHAGNTEVSNLKWDDWIAEISCCIHDEIIYECLLGMKYLLLVQCLFSVSGDFGFLI